MKIKEYSFGAGVLSKLDERVLYIRFEKTLVDVDDLLKIKSYRKRLIGNKTYGSIVDIRDERVSMTKEAKSYIANNPELNSARLVESIVVSSLAQKMIVEAYVKLFKPKSVSRAFLDVMTAKDWVNMKLREIDSNNGLKDNSHD